MKEFLENYVQMMADANEIKLNKDQMQTIVNNLHQEDEIWDVLDSYVMEEIARAVKEDIYMGYRSDVYFKTTTEGWIIIQKVNNRDWRSSS